MADRCLHRFAARRASGCVRQRHACPDPRADRRSHHHRRRPDRDPRYRRRAQGPRTSFPPSLFLRPTPLTEVNPAIATFSRELRSESEDDVLGFLHALMMQINEHMTFDEDPTNSGTSAVEAFGLKRGVCQDYAHIFIACARGAGVPARFVAGHFLRSDGMINQQAGHAWAEAFVPDLGWVGFDPANGICTTDAHARVAIGLDYLGAAPVRGTRYGGGMETLSVAVKVDQAGRQGQSQSQS